MKDLLKQKKNLLILGSNDIPNTIYYACTSKSKPKIKGLTYPVIIKPADVVKYNHISFEGKNKIYKVYDEIEALNVEIEQKDLEIQRENNVTKEVIEEDNTTTQTNIILSDDTDAKASEY